MECFQQSQSCVAGRNASRLPRSLFRSAKLSLGLFSTEVNKTASSVNEGEASRQEIKGGENASGRALKIN